MTNPVRPLLSVRSLSRRFREGARMRSVLHELDLDVARGETVAVLGRSGSGKSTLLNLISGIDLPDEGSIDFDGVRLTGLDERARTIHRRDHVGFIFQFFHLIPTLTVRENVLFTLELQRQATRQRRAHALELVASVGLQDRLDSFPDVLSGGEQQRVAIARALAHGPSLILADEPTGNLDEASADTVVDLLFRLVREEGATLIVVTHSPTLAARTDRRFALHDGTLHDA